MQSNLRRFSKSAKELAQRIEKIQSLLNEKVGAAVVEKFYNFPLVDETLIAIHGFVLERLHAEVVDLEGVAIRVRFVKIPGRAVHSLVELSAVPKQ